uniref:Uncharacterized protein n=1 Tax=Anguilla anguilla TaxID=7936 RepID=A0A0E9PLP9_ANGAN
MTWWACLLHVLQYQSSLINPTVTRKLSTELKLTKGRQLTLLARRWVLND